MYAHVVGRRAMDRLGGADMFGTEARDEATTESLNAMFDTASSESIASHGGERDIQDRAPVLVRRLLSLTSACHPARPCPHARSAVPEPSPPKFGHPARNPNATSLPSAGPILPT